MKKFYLCVDIQNYDGSIVALNFPPCHFFECSDIVSALECVPGVDVVTLILREDK